MAANRELDAGQSHILPHAALEVTLTGAGSGTVKLAALDQAGGEIVTVRLASNQILITPEPRRLRLVAFPVDLNAFPAATSVGLTIMTKGASLASEQVLVATTDVGALTQCELAVVEFAPGRSIVTAVDTGSSREVDDSPPWLQAGRYALRDASRLTPGSPQRAGGSQRAWAVALDGSASLVAAQPREALTALLELACGTLVEWTGNWASAALLAGVSTLEVPDAPRNPEALVAALYDGGEPSSWCYLASAARTLAGKVGPGGSVLLIADGVPGDLAEVAQVAAAHPQVGFRLLAFGRSLHGLASDTILVEWWAESLSGVELADSVENFSVVAVRRDADGSPVLEGARAAELALRLTSETARSR